MNDDDQLAEAFGVDDDNGAAAAAPTDQFTKALESRLRAEFHAASETPSMTTDVSAAARDTDVSAPAPLGGMPIPVAELTEAAITTSRPRRRKLQAAIAIAIAAAAALVAGVLAANRGSDTSNKPLSVAAITAGTNGTVRVHVTVKLSADLTNPCAITTTTTSPTSTSATLCAGTGPENLGQEGVIDFDNHVGEMTISMHGAGSDARSTMLFADGKTYYDATSLLTMFSQIPQGNAAQLDKLKQQVTSGHVRWIELALTTPPGSSDSPLGPSLLGSDPSLLIDKLQASGVTIEKVGDETLGVVATSHYRFDIAQSKLGDPSESGDATFDLWTDDQHRLIQMTETPPRTASGFAASLVTITFSDYGGPDHLAKPADDEILSFTEYMKLMGGPTDIPEMPTPSTEPTKLDKPWTLVASGTDPVPWKIWYGSAAKNWQCFALEASDERGAPTTAIDGKPASCQQGTRDGLQLYGDFLSLRVVMGLAQVGVTDLTIHRADGSSVPLAIDANGAFGWYGAAAPKPVEVTWRDANGGAQSCKPIDLASSKQNNDLPPPNKNKASATTTSFPTGLRVCSSMFFTLNGNRLVQGSTATTSVAAP